MAQTRNQNRHYRKKKSNFLRNIIIVVIVFAVVAVALFLVTRGFSKMSDSLMKKVYKLDYTETIEKAASDYDLDKSLICGVIYTESRFDPDAGSHAGAQGLMQLMPTTFDWLANMRGEEIHEDDYTNPQINIDYGCYFLRWLLDRYDNTETALAAYNAGFGAVDGWLEDSSLSSDGKTLATIPVEETASYVPKVLSAAEKYKELYF